jgi:hypothetical protein
MDDPFTAEAVADGLQRFYRARLAGLQLALAKMPFATVHSIARLALSAAAATESG